MKQMRIGIAFFYHESHSFSRTKTTIQDFKNEGYFKGNQIFDVYTNTRTEVGGFIDVLRKLEEVEIVPLLCAAAVPSGPVTYETYEEIETELMGLMEAAGKLDGLLIALHGAMVIEGINDAEEYLLLKIRAKLGVDIPIATTLDLHANISPAIVGITPYHFGFKTYPHIDMYEQGVNAANALMNHLSLGVDYVARCVKIPMLLPSINMKTMEGPMAKMMKLAHRYEEEDGILNISVFGGFPYSDVPSAGASVIVIAKNQLLAERTASDLAKIFWKLREEFIVKLPDVKEAFQLALAMKKNKPIALADISDNPLSGGSGDTTKLLRECIEYNREKTLFGALTDSKAIDICRSVGVGGTVQLSLGGKIYPEFGLPVNVQATVIRLTDGVFYNSGPFNKDLKVDVKGACWIRVGNIDILLIGRPMSANDPELFRHIGIEPSAYRYLILKAKNHFRAAFDPLISEVIYVDAPGAAANNIAQLPYKNIPEQTWPLKNIEFLKVEERKKS
ncbi:M81 family metallopeptidase [Pradoshia sp. D12]|nr:M81 family metallopeptidase [Pradoshia sp. D12]TPF73301.1 M81 family metallopeptidase [Bacillus sp. D12]